MIWTIARREFLEYLKSLRFVIGFVTTASLMVVSTFINAGDYRDRTEEYRAAQSELGGDPVRMNLFRPPEPLSTFVTGIERTAGNQMEISDWHLPARLTGYMGGYVTTHHRFVAGFPVVDLSFVVRIVMSLMVIFLGFSAVAADKTGGTLRLALSNPVPRTSLFAGKSLGGILFILATLTSAVLLSLIVSVRVLPSSLGIQEWFRIACMFLTSALYLTVFFAMSMLASVIAPRSSTALLILLQAWVFLVIVYPILAVVGAAQIHPLPSQEEIAERRRAASEPFYEKTLEISGEFRRYREAGETIPQDLRMRSF